MTAMNKDYENHLDEHEARWFAIYTRYKREKLVSRQLEEKGITSYLPLQNFTRHYTRKVKHVQLPLISCYVFTKITKTEYVPVLEVQDVVKFVQFSRNLIAIPETEIEVMKRITGEKLDLEVEPYSYQVGDEVEIISGNLLGLKGKLLRTGKKNFLIDLKSIGYALKIEVDPSILKKVQKPAFANI